MKRCQLQCLDETSKPIGFFEVLWQRRNYLKRILNRRVFYIKNLIVPLNNSYTSAEHVVKPVQGIMLKAGDSVRIKSRGEIQATLN
jgi:hypothetical protein